MLANPLAITTSSLGLHPSHTLPEKLTAAASTGFTSIEIVYQELLDYGLTQTPPVDATNAARTIAHLCHSLNITVLALNPFKNFEGHNSPISSRLESAKQWIEIAKVLGAKYLQVPSQFDTENSVGDWAVLVDELQQLSDLAASSSVSIAYEAVAWGSYVNTWEESLKVVQDVNRGNFGLCLDTFHVAARVWGDNTVDSGIRQGGERALRASLDRFVERCPMEKVFYVQLSDAERFEPPLAAGHRFYQEGFAPGLTWSRNMRVFPLEREYGAYFPVVEIARVWMKEKQWGGVVSMEVFDWRMREEARRPMENAARGMQSWRRLVTALQSSD
ncbi:xylose isomerase-like protein [Aspergillus karnatakaensis]|uniref:sugar phosphate isomerase/epimerase family protein n=1 Tax=Aspergillus karnatakaensis TaxID=1810916 RepID=UPI003CCDD132